MAYTIDFLVTRLPIRNWNSGTKDGSSSYLNVTRLPIRNWNSNSNVP